MLLQHARVRAGVVAALPLVMCLGAQADDADQPSATHEADAESGRLEEITVIAHPLSSGDGLSQAAVVLQGEALERELSDSIGATVAHQPGIHSASFGQAVGRPVVHGLGGARVRVMEDRIDSMDVSTGSGDHAVAVDPFLANAVEVLKGPSTLLYGSGAIGGVINVDNGRIPQGEDDALAGQLLLRATDNGNGRNSAFRLDRGGKVAWHIGAFTRSADEYEIPGFTRSERLRAEEEHEEHEEEHDEHEDEHDEHEDEHEEHEEEEVFGHLPGSFSEAKGGALGASWIGERGLVGGSASRLSYRYGLPGHSHAHHDDDHDDGHADDHDDDHADDGHDDDHEDEHGEESGTLDMEQTRLDFEAVVANPMLDFTALNFRFGSNDYEHIEIEPNGEVGTRFAVKAFEGRIELAQLDDVGVDGVVGTQFARRSFSAIGEEAFVPPVDSTFVGGFLLGERSLDSFDLESGLRLERVRHDPEADSEVSFTVASATVGIVVPAGSALLGLHGGYSARAPVAEELFSNGPHLAVGSFEVGDPGLGVESAWHGSATLAWRNERVELNATAYVYAFQDYIYSFATGDMEDDLPVVRYGQANALLRGVDFAASFTVAVFGGGRLQTSVLFDTLAAELDIAGNDTLPLLPPARAGVGLHLDHERYRADLDFLRVFAQDDSAAFELPTDAYNDLRLHMAANFAVGASDLRLFLQGRNLTDAEQRHHTSLIKDVAPAPGRTVEIGVQLSF